MRHRTVLLVFALWLGLVAFADGRTWTDSTGYYRVEADLIGFNDATVVLKKDNRQLVAIPIAKLSRGGPGLSGVQGRGRAGTPLRRCACRPGPWPRGCKVVGRVVDYARKDVTIQQRRGKTYVNDRLFAQSSRGLSEDAAEARAPTSRSPDRR